MIGPTNDTSVLQRDNDDLRRENKSLMGIIDALRRRLAGDEVPSFESYLSIDDLRQIFATNSYVDDDGNQLAVVISNTVRVKKVSIIIWMKDVETPSSIEVSSGQAKTLAKALFGFADIIDST